jgi:hypothetical protein
MTTKLQCQLLCDVIDHQYVLLSSLCWCSPHFIVCQSWISVPEESEVLCNLFFTCTYLHGARGGAVG